MSFLRTSLLITCSLLPDASARRDQADALALAFFSDGVGHERNSRFSSETERLPAELSAFVGAVLLEQGVGILEDGH